MTTLKQFADYRVLELVNQFAAEVHHVCENDDAEAIHDLRVSIRRLSQSLRALRSLYGKQPSRQVRRRLKQMMNLAGEVRTRDIALELLSAAGVEAGSGACVHLLMERDDYIRQLVELAHEWRGTIGRECREVLELA